MTTLRIPDPSLVILIGAAGAGKTTLARRCFDQDEILSSDGLRATVSGDEADQRASPVAFRILHRLLERRLADGRLTVIDATNVRRVYRRALLARARRAAVPAIALVLDLPTAEILAQNAARARRVDEAVIERQIAAMRAGIDDGGLAAEGFETVLVLRSAAAVAALDIIRGSTRRTATSGAEPTSRA